MMPELGTHSLDTLDLPVQSLGQAKLGSGQDQVLPWLVEGGTGWEAPRLSPPKAWHVL